MSQTTVTQSASGQPQPIRTQRFGRAISRSLGSLQLAILLLSLFVVVLFLGTLIESWYDGKVASQIVYQAWWFTTLLALLGANILFAAVKKWPWKRHQIGFLITHVGLLCLVAGGMLTSVTGTSAVMILVDSDLPATRKFGFHTSDLLIDRNIDVIHVVRPQDMNSEVFRADFHPGISAWKEDEFIQPRLGLLALTLNWIAHPFPRKWSRDIGNGAQLEVLNYYPHARSLKNGSVFAPEHRRLGLEDQETLPALRCRLSASGQDREFWVGKTDRGFTSVVVGNEKFLVGYNSKLTYLDFDLTLLRAEQTLDRGSSQAASQSSYVLLRNRQDDLVPRSQVITLNDPLVYRGYKFFQSEYKSLGFDDSSRPVNQSVLKVTRDPGVRLKYAGSIMVALGIACMFYMRAYSFKPRQTAGKAKASAKRLRKKNA